MYRYILNMTTMMMQRTKEREQNGSWYRKGVQPIISINYSYVWKTNTSHHTGIHNMCNCKPEGIPWESIGQQSLKKETEFQPWYWCQWQFHPNFLVSLTVLKNTKFPQKVLNLNISLWFFRWRVRTGTYMDIEINGRLSAFCTNLHGSLVEGM